jgi:hypothetical protein
LSGTKKKTGRAKVSQSVAGGYYSAALVLLENGGDGKREKGEKRERGVEP